MSIVKISVKGAKPVFVGKSKKGGGKGPTNDPGEESAKRRRDRDVKKEKMPRAK